MISNYCSPIRALHSTPQHSTAVHCTTPPHHESSKPTPLFHQLLNNHVTPPLHYATTPPIKQPNAQLHRTTNLANLLHHFTNYSITTSLHHTTTPPIKQPTPELHRTTNLANPLHHSTNKSITTSLHHSSNPHHHPPLIRLFNIHPFNAVYQTIQNLYDYLCLLKQIF